MIMKKLLYILLGLLFPLVSFAQNQIQHDSLYVSSTELAEKIIEEAYRHLGVRYKYGANGPKSFDCTGFTCYVYNKFGYKLSRSSKDQAKDGRPVEGSFSNLQKGDILIFGSRKNKKVIGHAGIFIELVDSTARDFRFIHASTKRGITISNLSETYYSDRFLGARRILPDIIPGNLPAPQLNDNSFFIHDTIYIEAATSDKQIVLTENGRWFYKDQNGKIIQPDSSVNIILRGNGMWQIISEQGKMIPQLSQSNQPLADKSPATKPKEQKDAQYHTIKAGDTLYGIAKKYATTIDKLCSLNGITKKTVLRAGRKLRVK